jgi:hypothetical protein
VRALAARGDADLLAALRAVLVREVDGEVALLTAWPPDWVGQPIDVRAAPTRRGPVSYSVRWHGDRPAVLWEGPAGMRFTAPGLDPMWTTTEARGEALLTYRETRR